MEYSAEYYKNNKQEGDRIGLKFFARILKKYFKKGAICDYGCGTGHFLKRFAPPSYEQFGCEISEYARQASNEINPQALLITPAEYEKLIGDYSLDCISALHVLEHIEGLEEILSSFNRKLKKRGVGFFIVPNTKSLGKILKKNSWFGYRDKTHVSLLDPEDWLNLMRQNGFEIVKVGTDGLWDIPYIKFLPDVLNKLLFYPTAALQILTASLFLPLIFGENLIIITRKHD